MLSTSSVDKMAVEAYSKFLLRALRFCCFMLVTSLATTINQNGVPNTIYTEQASLAPTHVELKDNVVGNRYDQPLFGHFWQNPWETER